jgi:hypothetical protein
MHLVNFLAPAEITGEIRSSEFGLNWALKRIRALWHVS